jgi:hypothetical protein
MDIDQHCLNIIKSRRICNKIVILCEGDLPQENGRLSPQLYGRNETLPDANFYKACLPRYWREKTPEFFNSGSRAEVIKTYQRLAEIGNENGKDSYLSPEKVFAIIDIDLQSQSLIDDSFPYPFPDIDTAFGHLYNGNTVNIDNADQHHIWFTGLIHKESYFLVPELQEVFDEISSSSCHNGCQYKNDALNLNIVHQEMAKDAIKDKDLEKNWSRAASRIQKCENLQLESQESFRDSWQKQWETHASDRNKLKELAYALLAVRKAKPYWERVHPGDETAEDCEDRFRKFREDIALEIGRKFYAHQQGDPHEHLAYFFKYLYKLQSSVS